jgi:iron complex outermembrane recepter protein
MHSDERTVSRASGSRLTTVVAIALPSISAAAGAAVSGDSLEDLSRMSLQQLADVPVTSVHKSPEPLHEAPAAIYVITHDEIVRSGATSLAEVLRLAPNLRISQLTASSYSATARGFGGHQAYQNFPNKLLILIDGRSVYSPLFSGIYFDQLDLVLEDVERIEVISGPGATLWGANAVNGVINVITRAAGSTAGGLLGAGAGNREQDLSVRYGSQLSEEMAWRVYGLAFNMEPLELADHSSAQDRWSKGQGGFRMDWTHARDGITAQGDLYRGSEQVPGTADQKISGGNLLARWQHNSERSQLQLQTYFDQSERIGATGNGSFVLHTWDIQLQQTVSLGSAHALVWGAGERLNQYSITNGTSLLFEPFSRALTLSNLFVQDTISFGGGLALTAGLKLEDDPFSGWSILPDVRASWQVTERTVLWAASSRAIRSPTPFDVDVVEKLNNVVYLTGNGAFRPERVSAQQVGYHGQILPALSLSLSAFYN